MIQVNILYPPSKEQAFAPWLSGSTDTAPARLSPITNYHRVTVYRGTIFLLHRSHSLRKAEEKK